MSLLRTYEAVFEDYKLLCAELRKYVNASNIIDLNMENPLLLQRAYEVLADAEYLLAHEEFEDKQTMSKALIASAEKYKNDKVDVMRARAEISPENRSRRGATPRAQHLCKRAKGLVAAFEKREYALTNVTNILRRTE